MSRFLAQFWIDISFLTYTFFHSGYVISAGTVSVLPVSRFLAARALSLASSKYGAIQDRQLQCIGGAGSPPLVRERLVQYYHAIFKHGITPARAGKTLLLPVTVAAFKDHPRSCGKDILQGSVSANWVGSPPLVRERQERKDLDLQQMGITPARAGKTFRAG